MSDWYALVVLLGVMLVVSGCGPSTPPGPPHAVSSPSPASTSSSTPASTGPVSVAGARLQRGGQPFIVHGVQIVGIVAPDAALRGEYVTAHQHFGQAELNAARQFGANTIRFQVSQPGLDPQSSIYSAGYVSEVRSAVDLARGDGFVVILSMQDQPPSGERAWYRMPDDATARAWQTLAPLFASDPDVLYELFNEPDLNYQTGHDLTPTQADWQIWQSGGAVPALATYPGFQSIGMQALVNQIRTAGAHNVLIADGLAGAKVLAGVPLLSDPDQQVAYAVHPYFGNAVRLRSNATGVWSRDFTSLSTQVPVIVTEWDAISSAAGCQPNYPQLASELLTTLSQHQIGIVGFAFDLPGTLVTGWDYSPTTYDNFACGVHGSGPGQLLHQLFTTGHV